MSLRISISGKDRAAGRFVAKVRRALQRALIEEQSLTGLNQSEIARKIGVNRSVISREMNGLSDMTLSRVAEIAWAMGRKAEFSVSVGTAVSSAVSVNVPPTMIALNSNWSAQPDEIVLLGKPAVKVIAA